MIKSLVIICLLQTLSACGDNGKIVVSGATMGTTYSVTIPLVCEGLDREKLSAAIAAIVHRVDTRTSTYIEDSELSRLNNSPGGRWLPVSDDLFGVIQQALELGEVTGDAFDITIGPLVNLWGFGPRARIERAPTAARIEKVRGVVGRGKIVLRENPPAIKKLASGVYLDLSGIAKGYGVDRVAMYLESAGIENYLVEIGGEIRVKGLNANGNPWRIAVERPVANLRDIQKIIELRDTAIATSGDYRNYFEENGRRYSHTIDPRTGEPIKHSLASVSVLGHTAMYADAMATALMVLGLEKGFALAQKEQIAALFLVKEQQNFRERMTDAFKLRMSN